MHFVWSLLSPSCQHAWLATNKNNYREIVPYLRHLNITFNKCSSNRVAHAAKRLLSLSVTMLRHTDIREIDGIKGDAVESLCALLCKCKQLRSLTLNMNSFSKNVLGALSAEVIGNVEIIEVNSGFHILVEEFLNLLLGSPKLRILKLNFIVNRVSQARDVVETISDCVSYFCHLYLEEVHLGTAANESTLVLVNNLLLWCPNLKVLYIGSCAQLDCIGSLANSLKALPMCKHTHLQELTMRSSICTSDAMHTIVPGLPMLRHLTLRKCEHVGKYLSSALNDVTNCSLANAQCSPVIEELDLSLTNSCGNDVFIIVTSCLRLKKLNIARCPSAIAGLQLGLSHLSDRNIRTCLETVLALSWEVSKSDIDCLTNYCIRLLKL